MSLKHFTNTKRQVGGMSFICDNADDGYFATTPGQKLFPSGEKDFIIVAWFTTRARDPDRDDTPLNISNAWSWGINNDITGFDKSMTCRVLPGSGNRIQFLIYDGGVSSTILSILESNYSSVKRAFYPVVIRVTGDEVLMAGASRDETSGHPTGTVLTKATATKTVPIDLNDFNGPNGYAIFGRRDVDLGAQRCAMCNWGMYVLEDGKTWDDIVINGNSLDSDEGLLNFIYDPHTWVTAGDEVDAWAGKLSFDIVDKHGEQAEARYLTSGEDGIKCIHTGVTGTYTDAGNPTKFYTRGPYGFIADRPAYVMSLAAEPSHVKYNEAIIGAEFIGVEPSSRLITGITRRDLNGNMFAPPVLIAGACKYKAFLALGDGLIDDNVTTVTIDAGDTIPVDTPASGYIKVEDDSQVERFLHYSSWSGQNFTIDTTDGNEDFATVSASSGNPVTILYTYETDGTDDDGFREWKENSRLVPGEVHEHVSVAVNNDESALLFLSGQHSDADNDIPEVGYTTYSTGFTGQISDGNFGMYAIGNTRKSYGPFIAAGNSGGIGAMREGSTILGQAKLVRVGKNGQPEIIDITTNSNPSNVAAGYGANAIKLDDRHVMLTYIVRMKANDGITPLTNWGQFQIICEAPIYSSLPMRFYAPRTGEDVTAEMGSLGWSDSRFYGVPSELVEKLKVGDRSIENIRTVKAPFHIISEIDEGGTYVAAMGSIKRVDDTHPIDDSVLFNDQPSEYVITVLKWNPNTKTLDFVREHDITETFRAMAPVDSFENPGIPEGLISAPRIVGVKNGRLMIAIAAAEGEDTSGERASVRYERYGRSLNFCTIDDWRSENPKIEVGRKALLPETFGRLALMYNTTSSKDDMLIVNALWGETQSYGGSPNVLPADTFVVDLESYLKSGQTDQEEMSNMMNNYLIEATEKLRSEVLDSSDAALNIKKTAQIVTKTLDN